MLPVCSPGCLLPAPEAHGLCPVLPSSPSRCALCVLAGVCWPYIIIVPLSSLCPQPQPADDRRLPAPAGRACSDC